MLALVRCLALVACGHAAGELPLDPVDTGATSPTDPTPTGGTTEDSADTAADTDTDTDTDTADTSETDAGAILTILVEGSPEDKAPDDGLAAQTPDPYLYGLQRLEALRYDGDPDPAPIFDHAPAHVLVDMHDKTEVAAVPIATLPDGTFTHLRVVLTVLECDVQTTLHSVPVLGDLATPVHIVYALSDFSDAGLTLSQGDATVTVDIAGTTFETRMTVPVAYPEPAPGAWAEAVGGLTYLTFALPEPIAVSSAPDRDLAFVIRFYVTDSFRWLDTPDPGFAEGTWDVDLVTGPEPVLRFGANAFAIEAEG